MNTSFRATPESIIPMAKPCWLWASVDAKKLRYPTFTAFLVRSRPFASPPNPYAWSPKDAFGKTMPLFKTIASPPALLSSTTVLQNVCDGNPLRAFGTPSAETGGRSCEAKKKLAGAVSPDLRPNTAAACVSTLVEVKLHRGTFRGLPRAVRPIVRHLHPTKDDGVEPAIKRQKQTAQKASRRRRRTLTRPGPGIALSHEPAKLDKASPHRVASGFWSVLLSSCWVCFLSMHLSQPGRTGQPHRRSTITLHASHEGGTP
mmetsp:Transcript_45111/g.125083  ORF Transcript_45111/g.125083 Transcript_45111/m.125083 type:complete len:259 (+) Transcript_45111:730-1506(+)